MTFRDILKESWLSVCGNRTRSCLTVLGIVIGVMAVVIMVAAGETVKRRISDRFSSLGSNTMMIRAGAAKRAGVHIGFTPTLTLEDGDYIRRLPDVIAITPVQGMNDTQIVYGNQNWATTVMGVGPEYPGVQATEMEFGVFFDAIAMRNAAMQAVIGPTTAAELGLPPDPVGQVIRIQNMPFTIIGMPHARGDSAIGSQDDMILIPVSTMRRRIQGSRFPNSVRGIAIKIEPHADSRIVADQITRLLRRRHRLKDGDPDDFQIMDMRDILDRMNRVVGYMQMLLISIASVSLLVGAIGIMNMMLVSVAERRREIGVRKAIGARERHIITQFMCEAVFFSFLGSLVGLVLGVALAQGVGRYILHYPVPLTIWPVVVSMSVALAVGFAAGVFPAYRAARLNPIDSLRRE